MIDANKAFRDYATRVSFNMTLSRNQIWVLRCIMLEIENSTLNFVERHAMGKALRERPGGGEWYNDNYIGGARRLMSMGLIEHTKGWIEDEENCRRMESLGKRPLKQYWGPSYQFTRAGLAVIELLRIAGLVPPAAANDAKPKKRRA